MSPSNRKTEKLLRHRRRLRWVLNAGAVSLGILAVAITLVIILSATGDRSGAMAVSGVVYVSLAVVIIDGMALLVCVTRATLALLDSGDLTNPSSAESSESLHGEQ